MLVVKIVVGVVLLFVAVIGALYAFDIPVGAEVTDKECTALEVDVKTAWFGVSTTVKDLPLAQCNAIQVGNFVEYRIRTERTSIYSSEGGSCIYDSENGPGGCDA